MSRAASGWPVALLLAAACGGASVRSAPGATPPSSTNGAEEDRVVGLREPLRPPELVFLPSARPVVTVRVVFRAGSADDPEGKEGLTRLLAHALVEGGAGGLSYAERMRRLYPLGARIDVQVDRDTLVFQGAVHRDHLEAFYKLFLETFAEPGFAEADVARLRERQLAELRLELKSSDDEALAKEALQALLYDGHPYGHPELGTVAGLQSIGREDLVAQHRRVLCGGRALVGVAGDVDEAFAERVRTDFGRLRWEGCAGRSPLPAPASGPRMVVVHRPQASGVSVSMGMPVEVDRNHPDYPALVLAAAYLGQHRQFIGRLMQEIRGKRGLNYGDYAYAEHFRQLGWTVHPAPNVLRRQQYMSIWLRTLAPEHALFAIRLAVRELERLGREGPSKEDFERVRRYVSDYYALFQQADTTRLGFALDDRLAGSTGPWLSRLRRAWASMTPDDVRAAVARHWPVERLRIAVVHPDAEAFAEAVAEGAPSPIDYGERPVPEEVRREDEAIASYPLGLRREEVVVVPIERLFEAAGGLP